ncbi:uncharacterized protein V6R79_003144 [Siganus canaliculatus]
MTSSNRTLRSLQSINDSLCRQFKLVSANINTVTALQCTDMTKPYTAALSVSLQGIKKSLRKQYELVSEDIDMIIGLQRLYSVSPQEGHRRARGGTQRRATDQRRTPGHQRRTVVYTSHTSLVPTCGKVKVCEYKDTNEGTVSSDDFIFLSVCEDREPMIASRDCEEWKLQLYPLTNQEYDAYFKTSFFIQWCDWGYLQGVLSKVDDAVKRDRVARFYESIRKHLIFGIYRLISRVPSCLPCVG